MKTEIAPQVEADVLEAIFANTLPHDFWSNQDDLCDCIYQRIGMWTNPYLGETLEVRLCCMWAKFEEQHPEFIRRTKAYKDGNAMAWVTEAAEWNGEAEMPKSLWYRQLARQQNRSVGDIRTEYADKDHLRPKGEPRPQPVPFLVRFSGDWVTIGLKAT